MLVTEAVAEGLRRRITVAIPSGEVTGARDERLAEIARTAAMPGFRPGRVPPALVRDRYGAAVLAEVLERRIKDAVADTLAQQGVVAAQEPQVEILAFAEGADLVLRLSFEAMPEVPLPDLGAIALERLSATPDEAAVEAALARLAVQKGVLEDVEPRPAARGEVLVCDIVGRLPSDLLTNGPGLGARAGRPGGPPTRWGLDTSAGLERDIVFAGEDEGLPCFDVAVRGIAGAGAFVRVFPGLAAGVPVTPGQSVTLKMRAALRSGGLPEGAVARLGLNERSQGAILRGLRAPAALGPEEFGATFALTADPTLRVVRPLLEIGLPKGAAVDLVLRIGPARLFPGEAEPDTLPFDDGSADGMAIEVGGRMPHPRLAALIEGMAPGERRVIDVVYPVEHPATELAGHRARYEVLARRLKQRRAADPDAALARALGAPDLDALRATVRTALQRDYDARARRLLKRATLDALTAVVTFAVPEGLVEAEFAEVWQRLEAERAAGRAPAGADEATSRAQYRTIAERRVRLRLLLSAIGQAHGVEVPVDDMARAIRREAARYPGQEEQVIAFFGRDTDAAAGLRAPLLEERIVDLVIARAQVAERKVTAKELFGAG